MEPILQADIFFFVATICFVFVSIALGIVFIRFAQGLKTLRSLLEQFKTQSKELGDGASDILERIENSFVFNLFFPKITGRKKKLK